MNIRIVPPSLENETAELKECLRRYTESVKEHREELAGLSWWKAIVLRRKLWAEAHRAYNQRKHRVYFSPPAKQSSESGVIQRVISRTALCLAVLICFTLVACKFPKPPPVPGPIQPPAPPGTRL